MGLGERKTLEFIERRILEITKMWEGVIKDN
jgi:hypothetical protein